MSRYESLIKYWEKKPPVHLLVKAYLMPEDPDQPTWETEDIEDLFARFAAANRGE